MALQWLKRWLRSWLDVPEQEGPAPRILEVELNGELDRVLVTGVLGLHLQANRKGGMQLISEAQCVDRDHFWRLWKELNTTSYETEDGTPFDPAKRHEDSKRTM